MPQNALSSLADLEIGGGTITSLTAFAPYEDNIPDTIGFPSTKVHRPKDFRLHGPPTDLSLQSDTFLLGVSSPV